LDDWRAVDADARFESTIIRRRGRYHLLLPERLDSLWEALEAEGREAHVAISLPGGGIVDLVIPQVSRLEAGGARFTLALPSDLNEVWEAARVIPTLLLPSVTGPFDLTSESPRSTLSPFILSFIVE